MDPSKELKPIKHINIRTRLFRALSSHPHDLLRLFQTVLATYYARFFLGICKKGTIVGVRCQFLDVKGIFIGEKCLLQDNVYIRAGTAGKVVIGDHCALNSFACIFGHGGVYIGDHAQIGPNVTITTTSHDFKKDMLATFEPVHIGEWSWIGSGSIVLPGVTIGDHTVVAAGSVVTRDIPSNSVYAGVPAKNIKKREDTR